MFEIQNAARVFYAQHLEQIAAYPADDWAIDAYAWDGSGIVLSPIENWLWTDIRNHGLVMYPQVPVAGFFVDFGNPAAGVAIECDGKAYHDPAKDAVRQQKIEAQGWTVYRFTGSQCRQDSVIEYLDEDDRESRRVSETSQRIKEIGQRHKVIIGSRGTRASGGPLSLDDFIESLLSGR